MITDKAYTIADACRFCWMCRHLCPIGLKTGKEMNTPRAKGLLLSLEKRGGVFDESVAEAMWECALCGACTNDCATGYEPPVFIREARTKAVVENLVPPDVAKIINQTLETGSIYGTPAENKLALLKDELAGLPAEAPVLLYVGDVAAAKEPAIATAAIHLLKKAGVAFTVLPNEPASGAYLGDLIGFVEEVRAQASSFAEAALAAGAKTIVPLDPIDARIMKHEYAEWNLLPQTEVITATQYIARLMADGALKPQPCGKGQTVTLHDTGALARDLDETQPLRDLVASMGFEVNEMFQNRKLAKSCGGALLSLYAPKLGYMTAQGRWEDSLRTSAKQMITESPASCHVLRRAVPQDMCLSDIFVLLDTATAN